MELYNIQVPKACVHQEGKILHLQNESKAIREEISKIKAVIGNSSSVKNANLNDWTKPKNPGPMGGDDASDVQLPSAVF
jgi:hypothetical protein